MLREDLPSLKGEQLREVSIQRQREEEKEQKLQISFCQKRESFHTRLEEQFPVHY